MTATKYPYDLSYGDVLIDLCSQGWTITAACAQLDIPPQIVYYWAREHEDFAEKLDLARAKRMAFFERRLMSPQFSNLTGATIFALKTAGDGGIGEWKEQRQLEVTGAGGRDLIPTEDLDPRRIARAVLLTLSQANLQPGDNAKVINHDVLPDDQA